MNVLFKQRLLQHIGPVWVSKSMPLHAPVCVRVAQGVGVEKQHLELDLRALP